MVLMPLIDGQTDPTIATYAKEGECSFRIASQRDSAGEAEAAVNEMIEKVDELIGKYIYSYDDEDLKEVVVHELTDKNLTLTSAESATGGMFAASITDVSGASSVLKQSYVVYSNEAKESVLGVSAETIEKYSVVSAEVAMEMARGALAKSGADISVSVTGYAGPEADPGRENGEAYIGYAYKDSYGSVPILTKRSDRKWNRHYFTLNMLRTVYNIINENEEFKKRYDFVG